MSGSHLSIDPQEILQAHMEGKNHRKKVAAAGVKGADLVCALCEVTSTDREGHERHLGGRRHRERVEGKAETKPCLPTEPTVIDYNKFVPAEVKTEVKTEVKLE